MTYINYSYECTVDGVTVAVRTHALAAEAYRNGVHFESIGATLAFLRHQLAVCRCQENNTGEAVTHYEGADPIMSRQPKVIKHSS
eukprot:SAG31_NODE_23295_length_507_cov_0.762255_1_plen_85_part_00